MVIARAQPALMELNAKAPSALPAKLVSSRPMELLVNCAQLERSPAFLEPQNVSTALVATPPPLREKVPVQPAPWVSSPTLERPAALACLLVSPRIPELARV